jgi:hypothetical protein
MIKDEDFLLVRFRQQSLVLQIREPPRALFFKLATLWIGGILSISC